MKKIALIAVAGLVAFGFDNAPAHATGASNRAWVSGKGTDAAGCGSPTNACRSLQYVHDNIIAAGGEIDVLDPAGYGAVTINRAISIVNDGAGTAGVQAASGAAITINAGAKDAVTLRGLNIDGLGTGENGVVFNSGASLNVVNCVVRHFAGGGIFGNGILMLPTAGAVNFLISNSILSDNANGGFNYSPPSGTASANGVIDRVTATNNNSGFGFFLESAKGAVIKVTISNSVASNNLENGFNFFSAPNSLNVMLDSSYASNNGQNGVFQADASAVVLLSRSVITGNSVGVYAATNVNSYGDNRINWNATDVTGTLNETSDRPR